MLEVHKGLNSSAMVGIIIFVYDLRLLSNDWYLDTEYRSIHRF